RQPRRARAGVRAPAALGVHAHRGAAGARARHRLSGQPYRGLLIILGAPTWPPDPHSLGPPRRTRAAPRTPPPPPRARRPGEAAAPLVNPRPPFARAPRRSRGGPRNPPPPFARAPRRSRGGPRNPQTPIRSGRPGEAVAALVTPRPPFARAALAKP